SVSFSGTDALSGGVTCDPAKSYSGPDTATAVVSGSCTDAAGNTGTAAATLKYDATAPTVTPALARAADKNGWDNPPVANAFSSADTLSGGVTCTTATYNGPDSATASLTASCTDAAGNAATASSTFKYDATAPTVTAALARAADSGTWYNHPVAASF